MSADAACPVCRGPLAGGELILVCAPCRDQLGGAAVRTTGEFRVPAGLVAGLEAGMASGSEAGMAAAAGATPARSPGAATPPAAGAGAAAATACTWCGKPGDLVRKLLGHGAVAICDGCVALCADILEAELGPGWR